MPLTDGSASPTAPTCCNRPALDVRFLDAVVGEDAIDEGWVERRGGSLVFLRAEVSTPSGKLAATASVIYRVRRPRAS